MNYTNLVFWESLKYSARATFKKPTYNSVVGILDIFNKAFILKTFGMSF